MNLLKDRGAVAARDVLVLTGCSGTLAIYEVHCGMAPNELNLKAFGGYC
jgi:hypothetical protein